MVVSASLRPLPKHLWVFRIHYLSLLIENCSWSWLETFHVIHVTYPTAARAGLKPFMLSLLHSQPFSISQPWNRRLLSNCPIVVSWYMPSLKVNCSTTSAESVRWTCVNQLCNRFDQRLNSWWVDILFQVLVCKCPYSMRSMSNQTEIMTIKFMLQQILLPI